tara:strand:- start:1757 stop:2011 length:255 start_codon:yes stop_codon:yes gene_type:complete
MKIGDYIRCVKTGEMVGSDEVFAHTGKKYPITKIVNSRRIEITSELGPEHSWSLDDEDFQEHFRVTNEVNSWSGSILKFNFILN